MNEIDVLKERVTKLEQKLSALYRSRQGLSVDPALNILGQDTEIKGNLDITGSYLVNGSSLTLDGSKITNYLTQTKGIGCRIERTSNQTIANATWQSASYQAIDWEVKPSDIDSQWDVGSPGRLTCQVAGLYVIVAQYRFAANATGVRGCAIQVNAVSQGGVTQVTTTGIDTQLLHVCTIPLVVGDFATCLVYQNSGGNLSGIYSSKAISLQWAKVG